MSKAFQFKKKKNQEFVRSAILWWNQSDIVRFTDKVS